MEKKVDGSCGCPPGQYLSGTSCLPCLSDHCLECHVGGVCTKCESGFLKDEQSKCWKECLATQYNPDQSRCLDCGLHCTSCTRGSGDCLVCKEGYKPELLEDNLKCYPQCSVSTQYRADQSTCKDCHESCLKCEDLTGKCKTCQKSLKFQSDESGNLVCKCQKGEFLKKGEGCLKCRDNCEECEDQTGKCSTCTFDYVLERSDPGCEKVDLPIMVTKTSYSEMNQQLKVEFNQKITTKELPGSLSFELFDPISQKTLQKITPKRATIEASERRIIVDFDFLEAGLDFEEHQIIVKEAIERAIIARNDTRVSFIRFPITKANISHFSSAAAQVANEFSQGSSAFLSILSIILVFVSISMAVVMIKLFQLLFFLLFINVRLPANASKFILSFRKNIMDYFPTFINMGKNETRGAGGAGSTLRRVVQTAVSQIGKREQSFNEFCIPHEKFDENDQTCSSFINLGSFISQLIIFIVAKSIIYLLLRCCRRKKDNKRSENQVNSVRGTQNKNQKKKIDSSGRKDSNVSQLNSKHFKKDFSRARFMLGGHGRRLWGRRRSEKGQKTKNKPDERGESGNNPNPKNSSLTERARVIEDKPATEEPGFFIRMLLKLDSFINITYFFNLFKAMQLKALIGTLVSIKNMDPRSFTGQANLVLSFSVLIFYLFFIASLSLLVYYKLKRIKLPWEYEVDPTYESLITRLNLFKEMKTIDKENKHIPQILLICILHDLVVPLILVLFVDIPTAQILLVMVVVAYVLYSTSRGLPYREKHKNLHEIGNKIMYFLVLAAFLLCHLTEGSITQRTKYFFIGFLIIGLIGLLIVLNLVIVLWTLVKKFRDRKKKKKSEKVKTEAISQVPRQVVIPSGSGGSGVSHLQIRRVSKENSNHRVKKSPLLALHDQSSLDQLDFYGGLDDSIEVRLKKNRGRKPSQGQVESTSGSFQLNTSQKKKIIKPSHFSKLGPQMHSGKQRLNRKRAGVHKKTYHHHQRRQRVEKSSEGSKKQNKQSKNEIKEERRRKGKGVQNVGSEAKSVQKNSIFQEVSKSDLLGKNLDSKHKKDTKRHGAVGSQEKKSYRWEEDQKMENKIQKKKRKQRGVRDSRRNLKQKTKIREEKSLI